MSFFCKILIVYLQIQVHINTNTEMIIGMLDTMHGCMHVLVECGDLCNRKYSIIAQS